MKILITGSSGFLGKYLVDNLKSNNQVFTLSKSDSDFNFDLSLQIPFFNDENFDLVIHAAGKAHRIPRNKLEIQSFYDTNFQGTVNLLKAFNVNNMPCKILFISTVSVYGKEEGFNINEEFPLNAQDPYGISKIKAEKYLLDWSKENKIICTILRLPLLIGVNPKGNFKSMINAIKNKYYFNIANCDVRKSMVLANDVSKYVIIASNFGGIYNLTDGVHPSFKELSNKIADKFGCSKIFEINYTILLILSIIGTLFGKFSPLNYSKFKKMTKNLTFSDNKARVTFGWNPSPVTENIEF